MNYRAQAIFGLKIGGAPRDSRRFLAALSASSRFSSDGVLRRASSLDMPNAPGGGREGRSEPRVPRAARCPRGASRGQSARQGQDWGERGAVDQRPQFGGARLGAPGCCSVLGALGGGGSHRFRPACPNLPRGTVTWGGSPPRGPTPPKFQTPRTPRACTCESLCEQWPPTLRSLAWARVGVRVGAVVDGCGSLDAKGWELRPKFTAPLLGTQPDTWSS